MQTWLEAAVDIFRKGGPVMWPLLAMSVVAATLIVERALFWLSTQGPLRGRWVLDVGDRLRQGDEAGARAIASRDPGVYGRIVTAILAVAPHDALAVEVTERYRPTLERFSATLSTIITAAPLLGILGTVTGIIQSFNLLGRTGGAVALESVATGIAEALITTATGLVITLFVLFPAMWFRARIERAVGHVEMLCAARLAGRGALVNVAAVNAAMKPAPAKG